MAARKGGKRGRRVLVNVFRPDKWFVREVEEAPVWEESAVLSEDPASLGAQARAPTDAPLANGSGDAVLDSPSDLLFKRIERYHSSSSDRRRVTKSNTSKKRGPRKQAPARALEYESEAAAADEEQRFLIQIAKLANRGARGSAEACEEVQEVLQGQLRAIEQEIDGLAENLKSFLRAVKDLENMPEIGPDYRAAPGRDSDVADADEEELYFRDVDFETSIWELEAMITEHSYDEAVSIVEDLRQRSREISDEKLVMRLEGAVSVLCRELQWLGSASGNVGHCIQLLTRLDRRADARSLLLSSASTRLESRLHALACGSPPGQALGEIFCEQYDELCNTLVAYRQTTQYEFGAMPTFMGWFVAEITSAYDTFVAPLMTNFEHLTLMAVPMVQQLRLKLSQRPPQEDLRAMYMARLSELLRGDVCRLLLTEQESIIDAVELRARDERDELMEVAIDELIKKSVVDPVAAGTRVKMLASGLALCRSLGGLLTMAGAFQMEEIHSELQRAVCRSLEAYIAELSSTGAREDQRKVTFASLATAFMPYAKFAVEKATNCPATELDELRRRFLALAGNSAQSADSLVVVPGEDDLRPKRSSNPSPWQSGRVDSYSVEHDNYKLRRSHHDDLGSQLRRESHRRELLRQRIRDEREKKLFM